MSPRPANHLAQFGQQLPAYAQINSRNIMEGYGEAGRGIARGLHNLPNAVLGGMEIAYRAKEMRDLDERLGMQDRVLALKERHLDLRAKEAQLGMALQKVNLARETAQTQQELSQMTVQIDDGRFMGPEMDGEGNMTMKVLSQDSPRVQGELGARQHAGVMQHYAEVAAANKAVQPPGGGRGGGKGPPAGVGRLDWARQQALDAAEGDVDLRKTIEKDYKELKAQSQAATQTPLQRWTSQGTGREVTVNMLLQAGIPEGEIDATIQSYISQNNIPPEEQDQAIEKPLEKGVLYPFKLQNCTGCSKCAEICPCGFIEMH